MARARSSWPRTPAAPSLRGAARLALLLLLAVVLAAAAPASAHGARQLLQQQHFEEEDPAAVAATATAAAAVWPTVASDAAAAHAAEHNMAAVVAQAAVDAAAFPTNSTPGSRRLDPVGAGTRAGFYRCSSRVPSAVDADRENRQMASAVRRYGLGGGGYSPLNANGSTNGTANITTYQVPLHFHVIRSTSGAGEVSNARIAAQVAVIDAAFRPYFNFTLTTITRTNNNAWYTMRSFSNTELTAKTQLRRGSRRDLNIYTCSSSGSVLGWAGLFPYELDSYPLAWDGVVLRFTTLPNGTAPFGEGDTATHEVGHWLNLFHAFQGGCTGGDGVDDTPAEASPATGCPVGRDSCTTAPGLDPITNFMDYSDDPCLTHFTRQQYARMQAAWLQYRAGR